jgi:FlaA1/EpsC-like NDP-sugar epimerase
MLGVRVDARIDPTKLRLSVQGDDESRAWREQFLRDNADVGYLDSNRIPLRFDSETRSDDSTPGDAGSVVVWGAGSSAQTIIRQRLDLSSISYFVDSDKQKHGKTCLGLPIRPPEALEDEDSCVVLISSVKYESMIRSQIERQFASHVRQVLSLDDLLEPPSRATRANVSPILADVPRSR